MMRWIVESSIQARLIVVVIAVAVMGFGIVQLGDAPVDVLPEFSPPLVEVQTEALGLSAAEVEALITVPMEADLLNGVAWLDQIHSQSVTGLSSILLIFEPGTDPIRARQMVAERLTQAHALPNVSTPPVMLQPLSSSSRVMMVGVSSDELSPIEMSVLARWNIKPALMGVPGVANVAIWGQRERQLQVQVDPEQLHDKGVTLQQVIETTGEALWVSPLSYLESSTPGTGGWIDTPNQRLGVRHILPIITPEDLSQVVVVDTDRELQLGDVANVVEDHQPLIGDAVLEDGQGLILVIEKFPEENALEVTRRVDEMFETLKPGMTGIEFDTTLFRPANYIETAIDNLSLALLIGAVLVLLVLFIFFFDWRTTLISLVAIPLSLTVAGLVLYLWGSTINMMVLAGLLIALGVIIDDAIIDVDNIRQRFYEHRQAGSDKSAIAIILEGSLEMRGAILYATTILVVVLVPVFLLQGLAGALSQPLVISYVVALLVSILVALTVTPALSMFLLSKASPKRGQSPLGSMLQGGYNGLLGWTVRKPLVAYLTAGILIVIGIAVGPMLEQKLLPTFKEPQLLIPWNGAPGTSRPAMNRITAQAMSELRSIPGVSNVGSHVGRAITGDQIVGVNSGELWVSLDPNADYDATVATVQNVVAGYPGLSREVQTYLPNRMSESLEANDIVTVRIFGHEFDVMRDKAEEVRQMIAGVDGVATAQVESLPDMPQLEVEVDLERAQEYGLKPGDVRRAASTLLSGLQVGNLFEEQKVFDVVVWGVPELRRSLTDIQELLIDTPGGDQVALGEVAEVRIVPAPTVIERDEVSRFIDVNANVSGRGLGAVAADIKAGLGNVSFPFEYHAEVLDDSVERQAGQQRLWGIVVAAAIGVFLLMQASFRSWRLAFVAFLTTPMVLTGGLLAALIGGGVLTLGSLFGLLAVLSIAVRNSLVLVKHLQYLQERDGEAFGPELVLRGVRERLAPILMTALATGLAFLPLVIFGNIAGYEIANPMAVVILGGLVTSTILNLVVIPPLYLRFGAKVEADLSPELFESQPAPASR